ncbi:MAG: hypothetical protein ABSH56_31495 [Bryobacteraceae bacterium]|jgi:hypothetical protein
MTVTVKNSTKNPLVVLPSVRRQAGHKNGQDPEFRVSGGVITILPKLPPADDEYTPAQRRAIDASLADVKAGRTFGPFGTHRVGHAASQVTGGAPALEEGTRDDR